MRSTIESIGAACTPPIKLAGPIPRSRSEKSSASLIGGVQATPIDSVVERLAAGWNALWH